MTKFTTLALVATLALTGAAAPAFAATTTASGNVPLCSAGGTNLDTQKDNLAAQLQLSTKAGSSIDVWNGCLKVMTTVDGKTNVAFYDPDSLKLVAELG